MRTSHQIVVTLLSPSRTASQRLLTRIQKWTSRDQSNVETHTATTDDLLNAKVNVPFFRNRGVESLILPVGDHVLLQCLHQPGSNSDTGERRMELLGVQTTSGISAQPLVQTIRDRFAQTSQTSWVSQLASLGWSLRGQSLRALQRLLQPPGFLPILDVANTTEPPPSSNPPLSLPQHGELKEVCIPTFVESVYPSTKQNLLETLTGNAFLLRPVTGLYQHSHSGLCIRPLPLSNEDRMLPPVSLVFHNDKKNVETTPSDKDDPTTTVFLIGRSGANLGQVMLRDPTFADVDVRLCSANQRKPMFAEAQESLLAGSLAELQSNRVQGASQQDDPNVNRGDCWMETRANLKHPRGFWKQSAQKIAKAPNLPYE